MSDDVPVTLCACGRYGYLPSDGVTRCFHCRNGTSPSPNASVSTYEWNTTHACHVCGVKGGFPCPVSCTREMGVRRAGALDSSGVEPPLWAVVAWVWDRREQYKPSSGTYEALSQLLRGLAHGDHVEAWKHGELDDLKKDAERVMRGR